jgi:formylmethanofuran--tetrahydromethanopterin N-formyltransferase
MVRRYMPVLSDPAFPPTIIRRRAMPELKVKGITIVETFAEAFPMVGTRVIITAPTLEWALIAARTMTGFATSVIACGAEAGIERILARDETLDGRPGVAVLLFTMNADKLQTQLRNRVGQCVLTSPGSACFAGLEGEKKLKLGASLRFFGDGWQVSKMVGGRRFWRIPVMDGEFLCEATTGMTKKAVGGGNLLVLGKSHKSVLAACTRAVNAIAELPGVITPFPGGIVRSGSKVGSKYKGQIASTNDAYCPTLKAAVNTALPLDVEAVMEIVIDGLSFEAIHKAMHAGIHAIAKGGAREGVTHISAGNYGGNLGPHHFHLKEIVG